MKKIALVIALLLSGSVFGQGAAPTQSVQSYLSQRNIIFLKNRIPAGVNSYSSLKSIIESNPNALIVFDTGRTYACSLLNTSNAGIDIKRGQRLYIPQSTTVAFNGNGSNQYGFWAKGGVHGWEITGGGKITFDSLNGATQTSGQYSCAISVGNYATGQGCENWEISDLRVETNRTTNGSVFVTGDSRNAAIRDIIIDTSACGAGILIHWGGADSAIGGTGPTYHPHNILIENVVARSLTTTGARAVELSGCFNIISRNIKSFNGGGVEVTAGDFGYYYVSANYGSLTTINGGQVHGQGIVFDGGYILDNEPVLSISGKGDISQMPAAADSLAWAIPVTFRNFNISTTLSNSVSLADCDGVRFENCMFNGNNGSSTVGITTGQNVDNLIVDGCRFYNYSQYGISLSYSDSVPMNPTIINSHFSRNETAGIYYNGFYGLIANNVFGDSVLGASENQDYGVSSGSTGYRVALLNNYCGEAASGSAFNLNNSSTAYPAFGNVIAAGVASLYAGYTTPLSITHSPFELPSGATIETNGGALTVRSSVNSTLNLQTNTSSGAIQSDINNDGTKELYVTKDSLRFDRPLKLGPSSSLALVETGGGTDTVSVKAPASITSNWTLTLPPAAPSSPSTEFLRGDGTWAVPSGSSGDITAVGSVTTGDAFAGSAADDDWHGLGATAGRYKYIDGTVDTLQTLAAQFQVMSSTNADSTTERFIVKDTVRSNVPLAVAGSGSGAIGLKGSTSGTVTQTVGSTITDYTITWPSSGPSGRKMLGYDGSAYGWLVDSNSGGGGSGTNGGKVLSVDSSGAAGNISLLDTNGVMIVDRGRVMSFKSGGVNTTDRDSMFLDNEFPLDSLATRDSVAFAFSSGADTGLVIGNKNDTTTIHGRDNSVLRIGRNGSAVYFRDDTVRVQERLRTGSAGVDSILYLGLESATVYPLGIYSTNSDSSLYVMPIKLSPGNDIEFYLERRSPSAGAIGGWGVRNAWGDLTIGEDTLTLGSTNRYDDSTKMLRITVPSGGSKPGDTAKIHKDYGNLQLSADTAVKVTAPNVNVGTSVGSSVVVGDTTNGWVTIGQYAAAADSCNLWQLPRRMKNGSGAQQWANGTNFIFLVRTIKNGIDSSSFARMAFGPNLNGAATSDSVYTLSVTGLLSAIPLSRSGQASFYAAGDSVFTSHSVSIGDTVMWAFFDSSYDASGTVSGNNSVSFILPSAYDCDSITFAYLAADSGAVDSIGLYVPKTATRQRADSLVSVTDVNLTSTSLAFNKVDINGNFDAGEEIRIRFRTSLPTGGGRVRFAYFTLWGKPQ